MSSSKSNFNLKEDQENDKLTKSQNERNYFYLKKQFEMFSSKNNDLIIHEVDERNENEIPLHSPPSKLPSPTPPVPSSNNQQQVYSITYQVIKNQANLIVNQCECQMKKETLTKVKLNNPSANCSKNASQRKDWEVAKIFILVIYLNFEEVKFFYFHFLYSLKNKMKRSQ